MGLLDFFCAKKPHGAAFYVYAYRFCYQYLPKRIFADPERFVKHFEVGGEQVLAQMLAGFFLEQGCRPDRDLLFGCSLHVTELTDNKRAIIIQYPTPPSARFELQPGIPLLPPYFSAVVFQRDTRKVESYYVLGQGVDSGTTFRRVTPDMNGNLGRGCAPELSAFVEWLASD